MSIFNWFKRGGKSPVISPAGCERKTARVISRGTSPLRTAGIFPPKNDTFNLRGRRLTVMAVFRIEKTRDYTLMHGIPPLLQELGLLPTTVFYFQTIVLKKKKSASKNSFLHK
jgi:hypothetical protein